MIPNDPAYRLLSRLRRPSLGLGLRLGLSGGATFNPLIMFANGEQGVWYDPSDLTSMFQDAAGTVPAAVDSVVGLIRDKSGRGNHASQATTASKPILRYSSGRYYLEFDGVDDWLETSAIDFTATDAMTVCMGVRKLTDLSSKMMLELSTTLANNGVFAFVSSPAGNLYYNFHSKGTVECQNGSGNYAAPHTAVITGQSDISADSSSLDINGVATTKTDNQGTGNFGNYALYIGRRAGASLAFNGHYYGMIVRGEASDSAMVSRTKAWINAKTGAY